MILRLSARIIIKFLRSSLSLIFLRMWLSIFNDVGIKVQNYEFMGVKKELFVIVQ